LLYKDNWWRKGVPEAVRKECVTRKEGDGEPLEDPYRYTMFINLGTIIGKNWEIFSLAMPPELKITKNTLLKENKLA
jgi:hypothetical protein